MSFVDILKPSKKGAFINVCFSFTLRSAKAYSTSEALISCFVREVNWLTISCPFSVLHTIKEIPLSSSLYPFFLAPQKSPKVISATLLAARLHV